MTDGHELRIGPLMSQIIFLHALLVLAGAMLWSVGDWDLELGC